MSIRINDSRAIVLQDPDDDEDDFDDDNPEDDDLEDEDEDSNGEDDDEPETWQVFCRADYCLLGRSLDFGPRSSYTGHGLSSALQI